jgi:uncharacterized membrane protein YphA (DoxX/SURF4 family)
MKGNKIQNYTVWILQIILGLLFMAAGVGKFLGASFWEKRFSDWGYPDHLYLFVGGLEVLAAVLLFIPRWSLYAASTLVVVMIGAVATHIFSQEFADILRPGLYLLFLSALVYLKRTQTSV